MSGKITKLYNRAGLWETRAQQASLKGDYDRAGRLRTKAMQLASEAKMIEEKKISPTK
ncbi:hypothetical protein [Cytobacillus praedii]|uniref:hypothetical protein n=1 Tax=Cytobacillus praedii TaxID=1742358 RepID=UPI000A7C84BA|nr:hypothetical protein [Cytobacillus praedii]